ncbi:baeRF2 domain-containing protein [Nocardiopsis lambiniae]|uniref:Peptide chain release factor 1 n=1 Tax=Nocardiopsis lambiniae TaxID=3075539 RepID=A0ABU2MC49_9ACTN|nr:hypothetical protein [Nocardiopsis sp. DSM 44743]MDT0330258.1 hypothetical protein [Nocardiopsis sp. DSM 44743]
MDLGFLRPLYESDAPVASVLLDTSRATIDADKKIELSWRHLREDLAATGADEADLKVLGEAVREGTSRAFGEHGHALYASEGRLLGVYTLSEPPSRDRALWSPVADTLPVVVDRGRHLPYALVALDRVNAKVYAYAGEPDPKPVTEKSFTGADLHNIPTMGRGGPGNLGGYGGDFVRKQYPLETWRENTARLAELVREAVAEVDARIILVGGDDEAIAYLRENMHERKLSIPIQVVPGGRGGPDAEERLHQAAAEALRAFVVDSHDEALDEFERKLAHDQAVRGTESTLPMLSEARVRTLLLGAERDGEPDLWGSPTEPILVAAKPTQLDDPDRAFKAPASALMLRSAAMSDAGFMEVLQHGETAADGGAILRFPK